MTRFELLLLAPDVVFSAFLLLGDRQSRIEVYHVANNSILTAPTAVTP
jgi:hypothetical protein